MAKDPVEVRDGSTGRRVDLEDWRLGRALERARALDPFSEKNLRADLLKKLGKEHRRQEVQLFNTQGASGGPAWTPLDPDYAARKRAHVGSKKILQWSGDMRRALVSEKDPRYIQRLKKSGKRVRFEFGARSDLAKIHTEHGVRRRLDKPPEVRARAKPPKPLKRAPIKRTGPHAPPVYAGTYEIVKRHALQKTQANQKAFDLIVEDYFNRRFFDVLRGGLGMAPRHTPTGER